MAAEDTGFKVEKLNGENYHSWKFQMKMYLIGKDLWELVTGEETLNAAANPEQQRRFRKRENVALATVCLSVETSLQIYVRSAKNAKEAWDNLEQHFERKSLSQKIFYRRKLYSARMGKGAKMIDHINYIKTLAEHLEAVDDEIAEKDLVIILISSLPEEYNYLITALETIAEEKLSWNYVRDRLIHEYDKMQGGSEGTVSTPKAEACQDALFTKKLTEHKKINNCKKFQCHYCKKPGHFARDCFKKKADAKNNPKNVSASMAETKQENGKVNEETATEIALAVGNTPSDKDDWWIDSGASQHMTPVKKGMYGYTPFKKPIEVKLADDTVIFAYGKGELQLVLYDGKDKNAKEAWDNLEQHFERKSLSQKIFYRRKLYSARMGKGAKMIDHINYIKTLAEHLEAVDDEIAEKDLVIILISSLPEEYNYLITALETIAEEKLSWNYVRDRLIHEYDKMQGGSEGTVSTPKAEACQDALFTKKLTEHKKINNCKKFQCHYCKKPGHFARDCFKKKADAKNNPKNVSASMAETKQENGKVNEETATEIALAVGNTPSDKDDWWIDSGASQHMTPVKKGMYGYTPFKKPIEVKLADDTVIFAYGKGELQLVLYDGKDKVSFHNNTIRFNLNRSHLVSMSANGKHRYESGAKKRAEKRRKEESSIANTKSIETETSSLNEQEPEVFDLSRENPTDRGHFKEDTKNAALKKNVIQHGPYRPCGPFESVDINGSATTNFSASYYNKRHQNMSLPRHWLCFSMVLRMPYCEVCWLFADCSTPIYDMQKGWINGVQGSLHNMLDKIKRHEKSNMHLHTSAAYMRWKVGKDFSDENENEIWR
eukprot:gene16775-8236_t